MTNRQVEQLLYLAGIRKLSTQSFYYGRTNVVNRSLESKGLIYRGEKGWKLTEKGYSYINGDLTYEERNPLAEI